MVSRVRRRGQGRADTRAALLQSATRVFLEEGFSGSRVDLIAERAGVNKAMIYYHFRSKRGLYQSVLLQLFKGGLEEAVRQAEREKDPRRRLIAFYGEVARVFAARTALPHLILREILAGGKNMAPATARNLVALLEFVARTLKQGVEEGRLRPVNPLIVHISAIAPLLLFFASQGFRSRMASLIPEGIVLPAPEEMLEHVASLIERGLTPSPVGREAEGGAPDTHSS